MGLLDYISETLWRWQYKLQHLGQSGDRTLADFSAANTTGLRSDSGDKSTANEPADLGTSISVKTLYEGPGSYRNSYDWVDYPPQQLSKSAVKAQDRVAFKVFMVKDREKPVISGRSSLRYQMLQIQSPLLIAYISEILQKQDVHLDVKNAFFEHPFRKLYFAYDDIVAKYRSCENSNQVKPLLLLLIKLLDEIVAETRAQVKQLRDNGLVSFKLAWAYFPKNTTVIDWGDGCELLCKVEDTLYKVESGSNTETLIVKSKVLQFTGTAFQWEKYECSLPHFSGNLPVTKLPAYPLEFYSAREEIVTRFTARGRRVLNYQGLSYVNYTGIALHHNGKKMCKENVDGRVLIDVIGLRKHHFAQGIREGTDPQTKQQQVVSGEDSDGNTSTPIALSTDGITNLATLNKAGSSIKRLSQVAQDRNKQVMLEREQAEPHLMYMFPLIEGYALKNKLWALFFIEDTSALAWNETAYDHLVYDEQQKDLVMSFVENHGKRSKAIQDVIAGKGEGLTILLSGPPGTGKTLMAEAIADRTKRPLLYLQAEDLGVSSETLGTKLRNILEMATEWDAVILLDEADVFMAQRAPNDIMRNELVSIFLRELEYFRGIIFLTTNMYDSIDSAFLSRISLHLLFKALTPEARLVVWRKFLDRLPTPPAKLVDVTTHAEEDVKDKADGLTGTFVDLTEDDFKELAAWQLNGRQIKTAVKMASSWCDHKGYNITLSRIENGIIVTSPHARKSARYTHYLPKA